MADVLAQVASARSTGPSRVLPWLILASAAGYLVVAGPGPVPVLLAALATLAFIGDRALGPLGAGLLVATALPYGRGADTEVWQLSGVTIRPQDAALAAALLAAVAIAWRARARWPQVNLAFATAFGAILAVGALALVTGLVADHGLREILRDVRVWALFTAGLLALLSGATRPQMMRGLLLGATSLAIVIVTAALLPAFDGGIKDQTLAYDRGTLRMQFGNSIFLLPAIAYSAARFVALRRTMYLAWLVLLLVAVVLSLTRMSILATAGVVAVAGVVHLMIGAGSVRRRASMAGILAGAVLVSAAIGVAINIAGTPRASVPVGSEPENAFDRLLGQGDASDFQAVFGQRSGRIASYLAAYDVIRESPVIGTGMGTLVPTGYAYSGARAHVIGYQSGVDDAYLTMGVKAGVVGITALGALLALPLLSLLRRNQVRITAWYLPAWLGVLALTLPQAFAMSGYAPFGISLLAVLLVLPSTRTAREAVRQRA